jgi:hypothetical protein
MTVIFFEGIDDLIFTGASHDSSVSKMLILTHADT